MGNGRVEDHWRDTDVRVEGPIVEYLQGAFADNWLEATGIVLGGDAYFPRPLPVAGTVHAQIIRSSPAGGSAAMYTAFLLAISSARRTIFITNPYFVPDGTMEEWTGLAADCYHELARSTGTRRQNDLNQRAQFGSTPASEVPPVPQK